MFIGDRSGRTNGGDLERFGDERSAVALAGARETRYWLTRAAEDADVSGVSV